uniref:Transposase Tc1-like domain-containing protein n=1 Tax=Cyprinus carpio carpio TaxID=630221 RepID=A0A9J8DBA5_CYPCA
MAVASVHLGVWSWSRQSPELQTECQNGKKGDLSNFERGMVVGARQAGLSISQSAELLELSRTSISRVYKEWCEKGKTSSMRQSCGRKCLVDARADRRATLTEITTRYNRGMQQSICEATTRTTLRRMGYNSRRTHRRLQFAQAHQNWTVEDWKNFAWSDESRFLLRHSDGRVRILRKQNENMDPSCLVTTVQAAGGVMVWGMFSWHTLGPLVPIGHRLNATAYLSIVSDHVHPFMTTMYPSSDGYFQQDNAPCHKHLWDVVERELCALDLKYYLCNQVNDIDIDTKYQNIYTVLSIDNTHFLFLSIFVN